MRKLTLGQTIGVSISAILIGLAIIVGISLISFGNVSRLNAVAERQCSNTVFMLNKEIDHLDWVIGLSGSLITSEEFTGQLDHTLCGFGQWFYGDAQEETDPQIVSLLNAIEPYHITLHSSAGEIKEAIAAGNMETAQGIYMETTLPSLVQVKEYIGDLVNIYMTDMSASTETLKNTLNNGNMLNIVVGITVLILSVGLCIWIIRFINRRLNSISDRLSSASEFVASASVQLANSGQQLSSGSSEQAASIEETSATMEETASMVKQNADNTRQASVLSREATGAASEGTGKMDEMFSSMEELKKSSTEISKIIKVIDDIAFNTNILALNAAVEAARAGEAGLGFAVVADEVRSLAQKSAKAAKDTAEIIERNISLSERGVGISGEVNEMLVEITNKTDNVNQLIAEITAASEEQSRGVEQVTTAISEMEIVVQENAAAAEESASSAEQLQSQAQELKQVVNELNLMIKGAKAELDSTEGYAARIASDASAVEERKTISRKSSGKIISPDKIIKLAEEAEF